MYFHSSVVNFLLKRMLSEIDFTQDSVFRSPGDCEAVNHFMLNLEKHCIENSDRENFAIEDFDFDKKISTIRKIVLDKIEFNHALADLYKRLLSNLELPSISKRQKKKASKRTNQSGKRCKGFSRLIRFSTKKPF